MPLDEPSWWYGAHDDSRTRLLLPIARIYGWAAERRISQSPRYASCLPVICIGNLTAGGTGKTPLAILVAQRLKARGLRVAFLSRGYGSHGGRAPRWVDAGGDTAREAGDEPLLLVREAPVLLSPDRAAGALAIEAAEPRPDVIVMDDGLQNPALAKDLTIAVVDGRRGVGNGAVIPAGPLRAPLDVQLARVDAIVVNQPATTVSGAGSVGGGVEGDDEAGVARWLRRHFEGPVIMVQAGPLGDVGWLDGAEVIAFSGIANPARFYGLLERLGARVLARVDFKDHHDFTQGEAERLLERAHAARARLVTTEKDYVRLIGAEGAREALRDAATALPIALHLNERDSERLDVLIDGCLAARRVA